jgi:hypothetical protein
MMATTSFMFRPSFQISKGQSRHQFESRAKSAIQVWHLSAPMAQKVVGLTENNCGGELSLGSLLYR